MRPSVADRLWAKVNKSGPIQAHMADCCWTWTGRLSEKGYGVFKIGRRQVGVHRAAWAVTAGPIPPGLWVLHKCDFRPCCNPGHLYLGTHSQNMADRDNRGRTVRGEADGYSKLSESAVKDILRAKEGRKILAAKYGVSYSAVEHVQRRRAWRHVEVDERG